MLICSLTIVLLVSVVSAETTTPKPDWENLKSTLGDAFQLSQVDDWIDQCVRPFADATSVSNYELFEQPSGLCMNQVSCAYEYCYGPLKHQSFVFTFSTSDYPLESFKSYEGLNLPDAVVHPEHVGDISKTLKFANDHKIGVSVKTSGHSHTGSSTKKDTILLNLSKLKKYSPQGSVVECEKNTVPNSGAYEQSCNLALARNKPAVVRVGGGEIFDELLRAVSVEWNNNPDNTKYHVVSGGAGTVSAAGGWLASGGLSGNNGMRLYGLGIDQVLHVEMVLPSGKHVRFGPTEWKEEEGRMYHLTTEVTGYCNVGELSDESLWDWQECEEDINFGDLWYAVRGGGGGTFGVVSSVYYQLHEYSPMEVAKITFETITSDAISEMQFLTLLSKYVEFILRFFFIPDSVGVTEKQSNSCSSPQEGGSKGGGFYCFFDGARAMRNAWKNFYGDEFETLTNVTVDTYFELITDNPTWADLLVKNGYSFPGVPDGRASDEPAPIASALFLSDSKKAIEMLMFPVEAIVQNVDKLVPMLMESYAQAANFGVWYIQGGLIQAADDGMNALAPNRRHVGFLMAVTNYDWREKFKQVFYGVSETGEPFTGDKMHGALCHNHASLDFPTPLKSDWTKDCNPEWPAEKKAEECYTFQEAAFGEDGVKKLEKIHSDVDPNHILQCADGVGYAEAETGDEIIDVNEPSIVDDSNVSIDSGDEEPKDSGSDDAATSSAMKMKLTFACIIVFSSLFLLH